MSSDLNILYNCRNTIIEMLRDRGFVVPDIYICKNFQEFRQLHNNKQLDIYVKDPTPCYVKFVILSKSRPQMIRDHITSIKENYSLTEDSDIIMVLKNKPHNTLYKLNKEHRNIQFFWINELIRNITHHSLNPLFQKLSPLEEEEVLKKYNLRSKNNLPLFLATDPICKYFNFKSGTICKIIKKSKTNGVYITYRCVK